MSKPTRTLVGVNGSDTIGATTTGADEESVRLGSSDPLPMFSTGRLDTDVLSVVVEPSLIELLSAAVLSSAISLAMFKSTDPDSLEPEQA